MNMYECGLTVSLVYFVYTTIICILCFESNSIANPTSRKKATKQKAIKNNHRNQSELISFDLLSVLRSHNVVETSDCQLTFTISFLSHTATTKTIIANEKLRNIRFFFSMFAAGE